MASRRRGTITERKREGDLRVFALRWYKGTDESGKRIYASKTVRCRTKKEAEEQLQEELSQPVHLDADSGRILFRDYATEWLEAHKLAHQVNTQAKYRRHLENHVAPFLGGLRLDRIGRKDLQRMVNVLAESGSPVTEGGPLSARTIRDVATLVGVVLEDAVVQGRIRYNPARGRRVLTLPKASKPEIDTMSPEEWVRFRLTLRGTKHETLFTLLGATGL